MIEFNKPPFIGTELEYIRQAAEENNKLCGDGPFTKKCSAWMQDNFNVKHAILTTSCTHALEMAAYLSEIQPGDEVIMPSYTFVSTADAFVLRGAKIVYVDIRPDTMNIDETKIEDAITEKTKAIVPVHYAGVACEMDTIMDIAKRHNLKVVEDAAQGVSAYYKGKALGTILAATASMRRKTIRWERAARCCSRMRIIWKKQRSFVKRERTAASFSADRSTNILGSTTVPPIYRAI